MNKAISHELSAMSSPRQRGFTLIELIIATGLFAVVALLSFAILSQAQRVEARTETQRRLSETARFVMETISRQTRLANGLIVETPDTGEEQTTPPFRIFAEDLVAQPGLDELVTGDELELATTQLPGPVHELTSFEIEDIDGHSVLMETECDSFTILPEPICLVPPERHRLTPTDIDVVALEFRGLPPEFATDRPPFLEMIIRFRALTPAASTGMIEHEVRTLVGVRNYHE